MSEKQIYSYLVEHCVKKDVAWLVARSTAQWRKGLGNKKASAETAISN